MITDYPFAICLFLAAYLFFFFSSPPAYPLAELIDNSLSATAKNTGTRIIEIRMVGSETANT